MYYIYICMLNIDCVCMRTSSIYNCFSYRSPSSPRTPSRYPSCLVRLAVAKAKGASDWDQQRLFWVDGLDMVRLDQTLDYLD